MSSDGFLEDRERALENDYFRRKDRELIERLHDEGRKEAERRGLGEKLGISPHWQSFKEGDADLAFLKELQADGFTSDNLALLHLVPLVEVAWSDGEVTSAERELILALAARRGVEAKSDAYRQLVGWLDTQPDQAFFETTYEAIRRMLALEDETSRHAAQEDLLAWSTKIAEATGGILGMVPISKDERECLRRITERISRSPGSEPS